MRKNWENAIFIGTQWDAVNFFDLLLREHHERNAVLKQFSAAAQPAENGKCDEQRGASLSNRVPSKG
jgi:hypothetical protein